VVLRSLPWFGGDHGLQGENTHDGALVICIVTGIRGEFRGASAA
jgi:hypothetical protein